MATRVLHPQQQAVLEDLYGNHPRYRQAVERLLLKLPHRAYISGDLLRDWLQHENHINAIERLENLRRLPLASASELFPYVAQILNMYRPGFLPAPEVIDEQRFMLEGPRHFDATGRARVRAGKQMEAAILELDGGAPPDARMIRKVRSSKPPFGLAGTPDWAKEITAGWAAGVDWANGIASRFDDVITDAKFMVTRKPPKKPEAYYGCQMHSYRILLQHAQGVPQKDWHNARIGMWLHRRFAAPPKGGTVEDMMDDIIAWGTPGKFSHEERMQIVAERTTQHTVEVPYDPAMTEAIVEAAAGIHYRLKAGWPLGQAQMDRLIDPPLAGSQARKAAPEPAPDLVRDCLFPGMSA